MSIKILIDSASDITKEEAEQMGISMIPMIVSFNDHEYLDGVNLYPKQFYEKLIEEDTLPKTSQITPVRFGEEYEKLTKDNNKLIVITISSKLSGTYSSAVLAAQEYEGKVYVVDSFSAAIGERLLCQYALRLIGQGLEIEKIVEELNSCKKRLNIIAMVNTLEYLKKGGRISSSVAFAGELLSIKPVLTVVDGEVKLIGKAIGSKKANNLLNKLILNKGIDFEMPYGVVRGGFDDKILNKYIVDSSHLWIEHTSEIPKYELGCTIGTHVGPGAIGLAFFEKEQ